jgi:hypothetical protein
MTKTPTEFSPSALLSLDTYLRVHPETWEKYLLSRGWEFVGAVEDEVRWFYHPERPKFRRDRRHPEYESAYNIPTEITRDKRIDDPDFLVKIVPMKFFDFPQRNAELLRDLERHEDRYAGQILVDIMAMDTGLQPKL